MKGFTLTEILIAFSVLGVLVAISVPVLRNIQPDLQLSAASRDLVTNLRYAQQLSMTEQVEHSVRFYPEEKRYEIKRYGETTEVLKTVSFPEKIISVTINGLSSIDSDKEARYNPYGAVKDSGSILLENSENQTKTIEVRPSGFVKLGS